MIGTEQHAFLARYVEAIAARDDDTLERLRADDYVEEWPQSGERVVGRGAMRAIEAGHPTRPTIVAGPRVTPLDDGVFVVEAVADYAGARTWLVERLGLRQGRVHRVVAYFADPFEPAAYRAAFVELHDAAAGLDEPEPEAPLREGASREVALRYAEALATTDLAAVRRLADPGWQGTYPQSGERFPALDAIVAAHDPYPGGLPDERVLGVAGAEDRWAVSPLLTPVRLSGNGAFWMSELALTYPNGERWFNVNLTTFRDGRAWRDRMYWARPFEAAAWRAHLVERFDVG